MDAFREHEWMRLCCSIQWFESDLKVYPCPEDTIIVATFGHACRRSILHGERMGESLLIRDVRFLVTRTGNVSSRQKEAVGCAKVLYCVNHHGLLHLHTVVMNKLILLKSEHVGYGH